MSPTLGQFALTHILPKSRQSPSIVENVRARLRTDFLMNPSHLERVYCSYPFSTDPSNTQRPGICAHLLSVSGELLPAQPAAAPLSALLQVGWPYTEYELAGYHSSHLYGLWFLLSFYRAPTRSRPHEGRYCACWLALGSQMLISCLAHSRDPNNPWK